MATPGIAANAYASLARITDPSGMGGGLSVTYERDDATTEARGTMAETTSDSDTLRFNYEGNVSENFRLGGMFSTNRSDVTTGDRKSTRLNSSHIPLSRMPSSA